MRLQSGLGDVNKVERGDLDNYGKISLGRVVKSNNRDNTADVILENGTFIGKEDEESKAVSCIRMMDYAGYHDENEIAYGEVKPLSIGDIVVVAFLESSKHKPIILGSIQNIDNIKTNNPFLNAKDEYLYDQYEKYEVNHLQDFSYYSGHGEFEKAHHSGAFFVGKTDKISDHRENAFCFEDLSLKNKFNNKTIKNETEPFKPLNFLAVTRNGDEDDETTLFTRFFHDAKEGITRFSRDSFRKLFYMEMNDDFTIQYNLKSNRRPRVKGEKNRYLHKTSRKSDHDFLYPKAPVEKYPRFFKIDDFTRIKIHENGDLELKAQKADNQTEIIISSKKVDVKTTKDVNIKSKTEINLIAPRINIKEEMPTFDIKEVDEQNEWECQWIE